MTSEQQHQKLGRCAQAHGYVASAIILLLKVHKSDLLYEDHVAYLEQAISALLTTKHMLADVAGLSGYRKEEK
jgi:hypothetical protein